MNDVARVDLTNAGDAVDRRLDVRVIEIEARGLDRRSVGARGGVELVDQCLLVVDLLLRDEIALPQLRVAVEIQLVVLHLRLVAEEGGLALMELNLVGPLVDDRDDLALLHRLALGEGHAVEATVDLGLHRHGVERRDGAEALDPDGDVFARGDRCWRWGPTRSVGAAEPDAAPAAFDVAPPAWCA